MKKMSVSGASEIQHFPVRTSAKKRALLLANHIANISMGEKASLSANEYNTLVGSFSTAHEIRVYNRIKEVDKCIRNVLPYLNQLRILYQENTATLTGYFNLLHTCQVMEQVLNQVAAAIPDAEARRQALQTAGLEQLVFASYKLQADNSLKLDIDTQSLPHELLSASGETDSLKDELSLRRLIHIYRERAKDGMVSVRTYIQAVKDYLAFEEANINIYLHKLTEIEADMQEDRSVFTRFSAQFTGNTSQDFLPRDPEMTYPDYITLAIDKEKYDAFKTRYLI